MDTQNNPHGNLEFREQMIYAIGYRLAENFAVTPVVGRLWVRHVMTYTVSSPHFKKVAEAAFEIYQPIIEAAMKVVLPMIGPIFHGAISVVQQENQRGYDTEQRSVGHEG